MCACMQWQAICHHDRYPFISEYLIFPFFETDRNATAALWTGFRRVLNGEEVHFRELECIFVFSIHPSLHFQFYLAGVIRQCIHVYWWVTGLGPVYLLPLTFKTAAWIINRHCIYKVAYCLDLVAIPDLLLSFLSQLYQFSMLVLHPFL